VRWIADAVRLCASLPCHLVSFPRFSFQFFWIPKKRNKKETVPRPREGRDACIALHDQYIIVIVIAASFFPPYIISFLLSIIFNFLVRICQLVDYSVLMTRSHNDACMEEYVCFRVDAHAAGIYRPSIYMAFQTGTAIERHAISLVLVNFIEIYNKNMAGSIDPSINLIWGK